jgi:DNA-binding transcriptional MerR regulator
MTKANLRRLEEGKLYYSISEVCAMTGLEQHVLRYWESEFPQLRPKKNRSGNRAYRSKEIKIIRYIKYLLYEEMYTIPGAKKKMADMNMADLEGQMALLRVPASPVPREPAVPQEAPAPAPSPGPALGPGPEEPAPEGERPEGRDRDGGEAAAKLREELRRVKKELQDLLAALAAAGKGAS